MLEKMKKFHEHVLQNPPKQRLIESREGSSRLGGETAQNSAKNYSNGEPHPSSNSNRIEPEPSKKQSGISQAGSTADPRTARPNPSPDGRSSKPNLAGSSQIGRIITSGVVSAAGSESAGLLGTRGNRPQNNGNQQEQASGASDHSSSSPDLAEAPTRPKTPPAKSRKQNPEGEYKIRKRNEPLTNYLDKREPLETDRDQTGVPTSKLAGDRIEPALTKPNLQSVLKTVLRATPVSEEGKKPFDFPYLEMYSRAAETLPKTLPALPPAQDTKWLKM